MNAIAAPKSRRLNLLEGMALTALFQAIPSPLQLVTNVMLLSLAAVGVARLM